MRVNKSVIFICGSLALSGRHGLYKRVVFRKCQ